MRFLTIVGNAYKLATAIVESLGAADGNKIVATDTNGRLHPSTMPEGIGANTHVYPASEAIGAGSFVNIWDDTGTDKVRLADASNGREANGFVLAAVASGANATIYLQGEATGQSGLTAGTEYFLSATNAGEPIALPSTASGHIWQLLGIATSPTAINFEYKKPTEIE
jgi:hypothetical protein